MTGFGYITTAEFKTITNIVLDDIIIDDALNCALQEMQKKIFVCRTYQTHGKSFKHFIRVPIADLNADGIVDKEDINAFEIDVDFNETDRNANITDFKPKYGVVEFDIEVPTDGRTLVIEYSTSIARNALIDCLFKELQRLLAVNWIFMNTPFDKLQKGITNWSLNGVSISFDLSAMQQVIEANQKRINALYYDLTPVYSLPARIGRLPSNTILGRFKDSLRFV